MLPTPAYPSAKKAGATPSGAGYRKGDLAQAVIALAVPGKPMPAAGAQRSVLGGKIADTRRPGRRQAAANRRRDEAMVLVL